MRRSLFFGASVLLVAASTRCAPPPELTAAERTQNEFLGSMVDLAALSTIDAVPWRSRLASSHDRRSVSPDDPSNWFANNDQRGFVRVDGDEHVMLEVDGPGVITRIWSADPSGTLRIYLDHESTPIVDAEMTSLFAGEIPPFVAPFVTRTAGGYHLMLPIPFRRGARITTTSSSIYYQVDYREYAASESSIETFDKSLSISPLPNAPRVAQVLAGAMPIPAGPSEQHTFEGSAPAPWIVPATNPHGARVDGLSLVVDRHDTDALRATVVRIYFDDELCVESPLGDLFAYEADGSPVNALPVRASADGEMLLAFPMPFARTLRIELEDAGAGPVRVAARAWLADVPFTDASMHFHARWSGIVPVDAVTPSDVRLASIEGTGRYVGTALRVFNPDRLWWGEGDEKVWVDDDTFPSRFGTGTEEYLGYAFCETTRFSTAYFGETRANFDNFAGYTSGYRFHIADSIPFSRRLNFDLEANHWSDPDRFATSLPMTYAAVSYFYARPGALYTPPPIARHEFTRLSADESVIEREGTTRTCR